MKQFISKKFPKFFRLLQRVQEQRRKLRKAYKLRKEYCLALLFRKPYLGKLYGGGPYLPDQSKGISLKRMVQICGGTKCLEVGSWVGGSSMIIGKELKKQGKGILYCIDTWRGSPNYDVYEAERRGINKDWVYKMFSRNIKVSGLNSYIIPIRKASDEAVKDFPKESFDLVFIDGDHAYGQFKRDLLNYRELVKIGGILCGDDLEKFLPQTDKELTFKYKEEDWLNDYHPGITLAINEIFKDEVWVKDSFWAIRKTDKGWEKVNC